MSTREYNSDAELHNALVHLGLRKIGAGTYFDDRASQTHYVEFPADPTPRERGILYEEIRETVMENRTGER